MNGRNRHMQYRRSVYRRRQIRLGLILSVVILAVLLLVFLIVGNLLFGKQEPDEEPDLQTNPPTTDNTDNKEKTPVASLRAKAVLLETSDSSTFATRIRRLTDTGAVSASIPLNTADGKLLYRSAVGEKLGYPTNGTPSVRISSALGQIDNAFYLSGVFYLNAFSESDPLLRSVELSKAAAILGEALEQGMDDVLLIAPGMSADQVDELLRFAEDVRTLSPKAVLGLTLSDSILSHDTASALIDKLANGLDFLAMDATQYGTEDPAAYATATVNDSNMMYNRLRYHMRVLLPACADEATRNSVIDAVEKNGVDSWQILGA